MLFGLTLTTTEAEMAIIGAIVIAACAIYFGKRLVMWIPGFRVWLGHTCEKKADQQDPVVQTGSPPSQAGQGSPTSSGAVANLHERMKPEGASGPPT